MIKNKFKKLLPSFLYQFFKKVYHILRYYNLINPNYSTTDKITFGSLDAGSFLKKRIINSKCFLEFGSGNTTIFANDNKTTFYSVESDRNFFTYMRKKKKIKNILFFSLGFVEFYSYPLFSSKILKFFYKNKAKAYASKIFEKLINNSIKPDLILVDGRYRVLCMLNIFKFLKKNDLSKTCVVLDDFKDRQHYEIIKNFFDISYSGRLGICYLKDQTSLISVDQLIEEYSHDPR